MIIIGKHRGKSKGKLLFSLVGFAIGTGFWGSHALFGAQTALAGGLYGASLAGTLWSSMHKESLDGSGSTVSVTRFDKAQNTVSSAATIPVVYGLRKIAVNQTFHETNADANTLHKHVILCEGGIEGVVSVTANDLLIPNGTQTGNTVFTIQNVKYKDATVFLHKKNLTLYANGQSKTLYLANKDDVENENLWEWQTNISSLISYINRLGNGWEAFPIATTNKYPGDLWDVYGSKTFHCTAMDDGTYGQKSCKKLGFNHGNSQSDYCQYNGMCMILVSNDGDSGGKQSPGGGWKYTYSAAACYNKPINVQASTVVGGTNYTYHDGDLPSNYTTVGSYAGCAWLDMNFIVSDELNGNPNVDVTLKGRKVLDTRTGITAYSTNPAMCLRDFMTNEVFGIGIPPEMLDEDSFKEAADYCDEVITYESFDDTIVSSKRYELNIVIDTQEDANDVVGNMLSCFCGYIVRNGGKYSLRIEKPTPISYQFNEGTILQDSISVSQTPLDEMYNEYDIKFIDPLNNWSSSTAIVEDTAAKKFYETTIMKEVNLEGVTSQNQVLRLARFYRDLNTECCIYIQFSTAAQASHLEVGDVIEVSYYDVFKNMPFRILEMSEQNDGSFSLKCRAYNESIYNDKLGARIVTYNYATIGSALTGEVPDVTNLSVTQDYYKEKDGTIISNLNIFFDEPKAYSYLDKFLVYYSVNGDDYVYYDSVLEGQLTISNIKTLCDYKVKIITENTAGRKSSGVESEVIFITGKDEPPAKPTGLSVREYEKGIVISWDANKEKDIAGYNVLQATGVGDYSEAKLVSGLMAGTSLTLPINDSLEYTFYVEAVDNSGNKSEATMYSYTPAIPDDVSGFDIVQLDSTLDFRWNAMKNCTFEIRRGETWDCSEIISKVANNYYQCLYPVAGSHKFWVKALNSGYRYSKNAVCAEITVLEDNTRNAIYTKSFPLEPWGSIRKNIHVSGNNLILDDGSPSGEYIVPISLPKKVQARNWIKTDVRGFEANPITWKEAAFTWESKEAESQWFPDGDISGSTISNQIAVKEELGDNVIEAFSFNNSTDGDRRTGAAVEKNIVYDAGRYFNGVRITDLTQLSYNISVPEEFSIVFTITIQDTLVDNSEIVTLYGDNGFLRLGYENKMFYLTDGKKTNWAKCEYSKNDNILIGFGQGKQKRRLYVRSVTQDKEGISEIEAMPVGSFNKVSLTRG